MCLSPVSLPNKHILVGCGKCLECLQMRSNAWAFRCMLESRLHEDNCMVTLTYNDANLPDKASLSRRDLQLFLKRLRKKVGKLRYFGCGEYGERRYRPHYHLIIFGWKPDDLRFFCFDNKKTPLYRSATLESVWTKGFSSVGDVTFDSAKYCAIYMQKAPKDDKLKPFLCMSRNPGIGHDAFKKDWFLSDKIYVSGKYVSIPKYFLDIAERDFGFDLTDFKAFRLKKCKDIMWKIMNNANWLFEERTRRIKKFEKIFHRSLDNDKMI